MQICVYYIVELANTMLSSFPETNFKYSVNRTPKGSFLEFQGRGDGNA